MRFSFFNFLGFCWSDWSSPRSTWLIKAVTNKVKQLNHGFTIKFNVLLSVNKKHAGHLNFAY